MNESAQAALPGERGLGDRTLTWLLMMGHLVNDWVVGTLWIIAPAIAAGMGLGPSEVGLILSASMVAGGFMYIPAGILSDRLSRQGMLLLVTFWWVAAGFLLASLAPGFWAIIIFLALGSMGDAFWHPVATGVLVKRMPHKRAHALGMHAVGGSVGAEILGPLAAGLLLGFLDWRTSMQVLVLPAVVMGIVFIPFAARITTRVTSRVTTAEMALLVRDWLRPRGVAMMALMVFYNMALYGLMAMTPLTLQRNFGVSPFMAGVLFAATLVAGAACQPYAGKVSDRVGRKPVILVMVLVAVAFAFASALAQGFWPFIISLVVAISLLTAVRPVILAAAVEYSRRSESTTLGVVFSILDGVGALGALIAGYAGEVDLSLAYLVSAGLGLAAVGLAAGTRFAARDVD